MPINITELQTLAEQKLEKSAFDYYAGGAQDEITLAENERAYRRLNVYYRTLVDVSRRNLETSVLGQRISMPVLVAPTAFHRLAHEDGERATARAAGRANTIMVLSSLSTVRIEDVVRESDAPLWFQLYVYKDRGATQGLLSRAKEAGAQAVVVTVDAPKLGRRERDVRNGFHLPEGLQAENLTPEGYEEIRRAETGSGLASYFESMIDDSLTWADLEWLRSATNLPLLIKGVVRADDAVRAVQSGVDGLIVSNHGGRQLDTAPATIDALPAVVEAVGGRAEVLIDGGIRRGTDVLKAIALGAKAVLLGRPVLWGLALEGEEGVSWVLETIRQELDQAMALAGCPDIDAITGDLVSRGLPEK